MELATDIVRWVRSEVSLDRCTVINAIPISMIKVGTALIHSIKTASSTNGCTLRSTGYWYQEIMGKDKRERVCVCVRERGATNFNTLYY